MITTFIVADNQDLTRAGIQAYIQSLFDNPTLNNVADKRALLNALTENPASVVILDYALFDLQGLEDLLVIHARFPKARFVLLSNELSEDFIRRACAQEHVSIVLKENSSEEIRAALMCAARGERYWCHQITFLVAGGFTSASASHNVLTPTEVEILKWIAKGATVKEMAAERNSSVHTIITHKKNIFRKLGVNNVYEATKYALRAGLIEMMEYYI